MSKLIELVKSGASIEAVIEKSQKELSNIDVQDSYGTDEFCYLAGYVEAVQTFGVAYARSKVAEYKATL